MKLPVEENSINHCGGRGNPKETGTYGSQLCERACATGKNIHVHICAGEGPYLL